MNIKNVDFLILGKGSFAVEIADLITDLPGHQFVGFVVSTPPFAPGQKLLGKPVYWVGDIGGFKDDYHVISAIGTTKRKKFIEQVLDLGFEFSTIIHPSARISKMSIINTGTVVSYGALIGSRTQIGKHVLINRGASIGHDILIEDYVTISPNANIASGVKIKEQARIGMGVNILDNCTVGNKAVVSAGSLVKEDVPDRAVVEGVPAIIIANNTDGL